VNRSDDDDDDDGPWIVVNSRRQNDVSRDECAATNEEADEQRYDQ
jgi:hypothetical protein